jgi:hypothetical protein
VTVRRRVALLAVVLLAGCGGSDSADLPVGGAAVQLEPDEFTAAIDNAWWPMKPGNHWAYREGDQRIDVTVTSRTRRILGIDARVVHDLATEDGKVVEDTFDWYAQDEDGNVWYLGEDTKEYAEGEVSTEGSWQAGVDGAQPGVVLPGDPQVGQAYRQEHYAGHAEDRAKVLALDAHATAPYGSFDGALLTEETTPLEPGLVERKYYARNVGPVLAVTVKGGADREELTSFEQR